MKMRKHTLLCALGKRIRPTVRGGDAAWARIISRYTSVIGERRGNMRGECIDELQNNELHEQLRIDEMGKTVKKKMVLVSDGRCRRGDTTSSSSAATPAPAPTAPPCAEVYNSLVLERRVLSRLLRAARRRRGDARLLASLSSPTATVESTRTVG